MLAEAFENVAPYISHLREIKEFVEENGDKSYEEVQRLIEMRMAEAPPDLATDYRILLNELRKMINTEM